jgi:Na+-translocating ferredoxin:NAD+ oxidoreductase subunit D
MIFEKKSLKMQLYKKALIRPFIYLKPSVSASSFSMLILLSVQIYMLIFTKSYASLWIIFASCTGSVSADYIDKLYHKTNRFTVIPEIVQGIIIGLLLPSSYPVFSVFFITIFSTLLSKFLAGEFACSWLNTAALSVIIAWIVGMSVFPGYTVSSEMLKMQNPSLILIQNGTFPLLKHDVAVTDFFNNTIFKLFNVSIPEGYVSLLWDNHSVIPAFRFNLITLISSIMLIATDAITFIVPLFFMITYGILVRFLLPLLCGGIQGQGDLLLAFLTSGILFCVLYLLQWFGTVPVTTTGKIYYAIIAGIIAFLVTGCGTSSVGMVFTILASNIVSLMIQVIEDNHNKKALHHLLEITHIKEGAK